MSTKTIVALLEAHSAAGKSNKLHEQNAAIAMLDATLAATCGATKEDVDRFFEYLCNVEDVDGFDKPAVMVEAFAAFVVMRRKVLALYRGGV